MSLECAPNILRNRFVGKLALIFGLMTLVMGWFAIDQFQRERAYASSGRTAVVQIAGSHLEQRQTMQGKRGRGGSNYDMEVTEFTYRDSDNQVVKFRREATSFPQNIRERFARKQPVSVEYIPGEPNSERWAGMGGGWKVPAVMFLVFGAVFVFAFRRGMAR